MILNGGKPTIQIAKTDVDGNIGKWKTLDNPKEDTTSMETKAGDKDEWFGEGHEKVDSYQKTSDYSLKFELFAKKGYEKPIPDVNGRITDNYAIRVIPEDPTCYGIFMPRCSVSCEETWSGKDTSLWKYTFDALKSPDTEELMDYFVYANLLVLSDNYVAFTKASGEQTVTAEIGAGTTITVSEELDWITTEVSGETISISASANSGEKRKGFITLTTDDGKSCQLKVIQAAGN